MKTAVNPITNDRIRAQGYSKQGEQTFDNIFGKRDYRNRPIVEDKPEENNKQEKKEA